MPPLPFLLKLTKLNKISHRTQKSINILKKFSENTCTEPGSELYLQSIAETIAELFALQDS
jgi:hypothetical protein